MDNGKSRPGPGLIKKEPDITDRRRSVLTLTRKGGVLIEQVKQILFVRIRTSFSRIKKI